MNEDNGESAAAAPGAPESGIDAEVAAAVSSAREARKARRRLEVDRLRAAADLRRSQDRTIHIDTIAVSGNPLCQYE
jgi:hypothetical protein